MTTTNTAPGGPRQQWQIGSCPSKENTRGDVDKLHKGTVDELDRLLKAKNVPGDAIERDGTTVIPIVSYGFGVSGKSGTKTGSGAGAGGGGGIKPLGAIIFDQAGARVEGVKGATSNVAEVIGEATEHVIDRQASSRCGGNGTPTG